MQAIATGMVVVDESRAGIADLLITAYHTASGVDDQNNWQRLGAAISDRGGRFTLEYPLPTAAARAGGGDLILEVCVLRGGSAQTAKRVALERRKNPATSERFLLQIPEDVLLQNGRAPRGSERELAQQLQRRDQSAQRLRAFDDDQNQRLATTLKRRLAVEREADNRVDQLLASFSTIDPAAGQRFVKPSDSVFAANLTSINDAISGPIAASALGGHVSLGQTQLEQLRGPDGTLPTSLPAAVLGKFLRPKGTPGGLDLYHGPPLNTLCREAVDRDPCLDVLEDGTGQAAPDDSDVVDPVDTPDASQPDTPLTETALPLLMNRLLDTVSAPESFSIFPFRSRARVEDVQEGIAGFALHSGPADEPSFHDFHHLTFAFDHVWTELMSSKLLQVSKEMLGKMVEMGVNPDDVGAADGTFKFRLPALKGVVNEDSVPPPPFKIVQVFEITRHEWAEVQRLGYDDELDALAERVIEGPKVVEFTQTGKSIWDIMEDLKKYAKAVQAAKEEYRAAKHRGQNIIRYARQSAFARPRFQQFHEILKALEDELKSPYNFKIFGANSRERSVNFGLLSTYRQQWQPVSYQVGELVRSVPLAPGEVRRFTHKTVMRRKRAQKEVDNNLSSVKSERAETVRAELEIVEKAHQKTNFSMSAQGGFNVLVASASASSAFSREAGAASQDTKKQFREAVFKSSEEYRQEHKLEVSFSTDFETTTEESGEISNPNDEITVTYLFYELQRRYRVSEKLHRVRPVVLVAQEVPNPGDIDDDWLIAHDWILRRVLLDDSFQPALDYLATKVTGDELALEELFQNVEQQRKIADDLKEELVELKDYEESRYAALQRTINRRADAVDEEESSGFFEDVGEFFAGDDSPTPEKMQIIEDAAREAYQRSAKQRKETQLRLSREITALNSVTDKYTRELSDHVNRRTQIARLSVHVKKNIMHYMQAIWAHEPPDQRFMRIKDVRVPVLTGSLNYSLAPDADATPVPPDWEKPMALTADCKLDPPTAFEPLSKVADIDDLLGFKGNYMILPLKEPNLLTEYMMTPYLDSVAGLRDPDPLAGWSLAEFGKYVCCLHRELDEADFSALRPGLIEAYKQLLQAPRSDNEEIVVPTDSLFIEALPGAHPILEDFKLYHRVIDVKGAQANVRREEMENLRAAARLLAGELDAPNVDKRIVVEGDDSPVITDE